MVVLYQKNVNLIKILFIFYGFSIIIRLISIVHLICVELLEKKLIIILIV